MKLTSLMIACGVMVSASITAQDWPQWRGEARDAKARKFQPPSSWPKELTPKWKVSVGSGDATPSLSGEKLYVFARQENQEVVLCLDPATGKEQWREKYEAPTVTGPDSGHAGPRSTPAVASGKVVTLGVSGILSCLDAGSGKLLWRKDEFPGSWPRFHVASSPLIHSGQCIAQLGKPGDGAIVSYDLASGEPKWKWTGDGPAYSSPIAAKIGGTDMIIAMSDKKMVCLAAEDGKLLWQTDFAPQGMAYNAATPIVEGETLMYGGQGRGFTAMKLAQDGAAVTTTELWKNPDNSVQFSTPLLKDGKLYGLSARSDFFCIDTKDGKTLWTAPLLPPQAGGAAEEGGGRRGGRMGRTAGYGSIVDAGSVLLSVSPISQLVVFEPSEKAYQEVARIKVAETPVFAHLVVAGNRLFVKDQDSVMLYRVE